MVSHLELLNKLRLINEVELHNRVYTEFLEALGASNIKNVHGPREFGRDFVFTLRSGLLDETVLAVCQIKNDKMSNRDAVATLKQLLQARETQINHPISNTKSTPQQSYLFSTYDLPDLPDCGPLLESVRKSSTLLTGERLAKKMVETIPETAKRIVDPGSSLYDAIVSHVRKHHESVAFELVDGPDLPDFYVNLGLQISTLRLQEILDSDPTKAEVQRSEWLFKPVGISLLLAAEELAKAFSVKFPPISELGARIHGDKVHVSYERFSEFWHNAIKGVQKEKRASVPTWIQRAFGLERLCDSLQNASAFGVWHTLGPELVQRIMSISIPRIRPMDLSEAETNIALVAEAGSGKTCFARSFVQQLNEKQQRVIYFPCLRYKSTKTSLKTAILDFLRELCPTQSEKELQECISQADYVVIDACDESLLFGEALGNAIKEFARPADIKTRFSREKGESELQIPDALEGKVEERRFKGVQREIRLCDWLSENDRRTIIEANSKTRYESRLRRLFAKASNTKQQKLLITSRTIEQLYLGEQFVSFRLEPFTREQVLDLFRKLLPESQFNEVKDLLENDENVWEICRNPLTATIVVALAVNKYDLPKSRTEVYKKRFDLLLERWDRLRNVPKRSSISPSDKLQFLMQMARSLHGRHERRFTHADAEKVLNSKLDQLKISLNIEQLLEELVSVDNVVYREGLDLYSLGHLSFQEYLAATAMVMRQEVAALARKHNEEWWKNVCVFFVGITGDATVLLDAIHDKQTVDPAMLEKLTKEARHTPGHIKTMLQELIALPESGDFGAEIE